MQDTPMTTMSRTGLAALLVSASYFTLLAGCGVDEGTRDMSRAAQTLGHADLASISSFASAKSDGSSVADRSWRLLSVLTGDKNLGPVTTATTSSGASDLRVDVHVKEHPSLHAWHMAADDSVEAFESVKGNHRPGPTDVSPARANELFENTLATLIAQGLVDPSRVRREDAVLRPRRAFEGRSDQAPTIWTEEYMYFVPLSIDGVRVGTYSHEYGVSINIHRSGKVRRIAIRAAGVAANNSGAVVHRRSTVRVGRRDKDVAGWVHARYPDADIRAVGARYVVSFENGASDVAPQELFEVTPRFMDSDGTMVESKRFTASYAVDDPTGEPVLWPEPGSTAPGAPATGKRQR